MMSYIKGKRSFTGTTTLYKNNCSNVVNSNFYVFCNMISKESVKCTIAFVSLKKKLPIQQHIERLCLKFLDCFNSIIHTILLPCLQKYPAGNTFPCITVSKMYHQCRYLYSKIHWSVVGTNVTNLVIDLMYFTVPISKRIESSLKLLLSSGLDYFY
jgi:hypothetical protein